MSISKLIESYSTYVKDRNLDRPTMVRVLEDVFRTLLRKKYVSDENFDVIINLDRGDLELWRKRQIVPDGEVEDDNIEVSLTEALKIEDDYEVGEECYERVEAEDFSRRAVMAARQTLKARINDLEKEEVYQKYLKRVGELVLAEVHQILKRDIILIDEATGDEILMPRRHAIKGEFFRPGDVIRAIILSVDMINNNPSIKVSRTDPSFLGKLMEQEVPEIEDGTIAIQRIVRLPGERAKIAVESFDDRIDPVGACVGVRGSRIHGIVRELRNENIDVINYTNNDTLMIQRALTPAKISRIDLFDLDDPKARRAEVFLPADQVSLAIGRGGQNIRLASDLTKFTIDVYRDTEVVEEDIDIEEFKDEIEEWIIDEFKKVGLDTAKTVLSISKEELINRTDLEEETIEEIITILQSEFKD